MYVLCFKLRECTGIPFAIAFKGVWLYFFAISTKNSNFCDPLFASVVDVAFPKMASTLV